jgi:hypothetical protein
MHEEFDSYSLSGEWRHVHYLVNPCLRIHTLMKDSLQDIAIDVCDVGVLPVKVDTIGRAIPMPKV